MDVFQVRKCGIGSVLGAAISIGRGFALYFLFGTSLSCATGTPEGSRLALDTLHTIEETLNRASTIRLKYTSEAKGLINGGARESIGSGTLLLTTGCKAYFSSESSSPQDGPSTLIIVSNGSEWRVVSAKSNNYRIETLVNGERLSGELQFVPGTTELDSDIALARAPATLRNALIGHIMRMGFFDDGITLRLLYDYGITFSEFLPLTLQRVEVGEDDTAKTLTCRYEIKEGDLTSETLAGAGPLILQDKLWYNPACCSLLKRVLTLKDKRERFISLVYTELYKEFILNSDIRDEKFTLEGATAKALPAKVDPAKRNWTEGVIQQICQSIDRYKIDQGSYPEKLRDLVTRPSGLDPTRYPPEGYLREIPKDAWNNFLLYWVPGKDGEPYDVASFGADAKQGGEGDARDIWSHEVYRRK